MTTTFPPEFSGVEDKFEVQSILKRNTIYQYYIIIIELIFVFK